MVHFIFSNDPISNLERSGCRIVNRWFVWNGGMIVELTGTARQIEHARQAEGYCGPMIPKPNLQEEDFTAPFFGCARG